MKLDIWIDAWSNTKQQNDDCEVNLRLSCANIEKTNPSRWIDVLTPNLLSNVQITKIQYYTQAKEFISEIIQQSNKLKSFSYPSSISISDNQDLQIKLKKFKNCIISRVEDMEEDS